MVSFTSKNHWLGDAFNILSMINITLFISVMVAHINKVPWIVFSPSYAKDGFCVAGDPSNFLMQSHAICFYEDTILALLIFLVVHFLGKGRIEEVHIAFHKRNALAIFIHGAAHLSIAYRDYLASLPQEKEEIESQNNHLTPSLRKSVLPMFWFAMMNLIHKDSKISTKLGHAAVWFCVHHFVVPRVYAFAFVHSALVMEMNLADLLQKSKDEFYNLRTIILLVPNSVIAWVEVFGCEKYLRPIGGHAVYDFSIPATSIIYLAILFWQSNYIKKRV